MEKEFKTCLINSCPVCGNGGIEFILNKYDDRFGQPDLFEYWECKKCKAVFLKNKIYNEYLPELYKKYYPAKTLVDSRSILLRKVLYFFRIDNLILNKLAGNIFLLDEIDEKLKILEIGSGFDKKTKEIINKKSLNWTGLEVNNECVDEIIKCGLPVYHGTIDDITMINEKFDVIILSQVMEHQYNISTFFENCKALLNNGGKILFTTPNIDSRYRKKYKGKWINWHAPYHITLLNKVSIEALCNKHGFKIKKYFTYTPTSWCILQKKFEIPKRGEVNGSLNQTCSLLKQFIVSLRLRVFEFIERKNGDCIYCEMEVKP